MFFIDIFSKYAWVVPLKDRKSVTIVSAFQKVLDKSKLKPNKIWVDKGSEFYNSSVTKLLKIMTLKYIWYITKENLSLSAVAKRFIRTLKTKI